MPRPEHRRRHRHRRHYYHPRHPAMRVWRPNYFGLPVFAYHHRVPPVEKPEEDLTEVDEPHWSTQPYVLMLVIAVLLLLSRTF
jgi:hypothetical protein